MPKPIHRQGRYMAGLDGLRAVAVLAVIAYHLNVPWLPGGLLGVSVFFVLSGYLITDLLIAQWRQNRRIDLKDFWIRRARRLLPALLVMIVVVVAWVTLTDRSQLPMLREDVVAAVLYVSNWWYIFHHVSYFESFSPSPLKHLWSLAVEEQFYLVWPLLLLLGLRFAPRRGALVALTLGGAALSAVWMAALYQPGSDPSRVYYGTDTRAFSLLIGAALAMVWPSGRLSAQMSQRARKTLDGLGTAGVIVIFLMFWQTNQYETFLYRGGFLLLAFTTAVVMAALAHPASRLSRIFSWKPLRWIGVRSYAIYLWHYPVIVLTTPIDNSGFSLVRSVLQIGASVALAAWSWRFVEDPIRRGAIGRFWSRVRTREWWLVRRRIRLTARRLLASVAALFVLGVSGCGMAGLTSRRPISAPTVPGSTTAPAANASVDTGLSRTASSNAVPNNPSRSTSQTSPASSKKTSPVQGGASTARTSSNGLGPTNATSQGVSGSPSQTTAGSPALSGQGITAIGDSIMVDVAPYLKQMLPGIVISAHVSRQMSEAPAVIAQLKQNGQLGNRVIIELGTNGPFTKQQLVSLLRSLGNVQQIVLVNTRDPRSWQGVVNTTLADVASSFPHTTLVNWYAASAGHPSYFYPDGVHLNPTGAQFYASLLKNAIQP
ncbi:acyltransferase family protein [Alicyclobacillus tolerans]|uniref:acyltransferase family protein n=1 Tax=Alicyclobacillus tolerans TaxID=90970 RepID=UPI001F008644|nr:acyltransferase family protein [Alicyclobacillus tolerans]MCF8564248.1 acyltransferase family protein [Alicyclobacillus tolerans]